MHNFFFQKDVVAESPDILMLGLLFGEDIDATTTDLPEVLSFQHKLLQDYLAAVYIAERAKTDASFLPNLFPDFRQISVYRDVVQFACGILAETNDAHHLTDHVAKKINELAQYELDDGMELFLGDQVSRSVVIYRPLPFELLATFQKEGRVSSLNPYIVEYPNGRHSLAEIMSQTQTVVIIKLDNNDNLQLKPSPANVILGPQIAVQAKDRDIFYQLITRLCSISANLTAFYNHQVQTCFQEIPMIRKLGSFPQLKYLSFTNFGGIDAENEAFTQSIGSWGPDAQLRYCYLGGIPLPKSAIDALSKCLHLHHLALYVSDLGGKLATFMASPPPGLRNLILYTCSLKSSDVHHIVEAVKEDRFPYLREVDLQCNPIGETAVNSLLEAIATRPHREISLKLDKTNHNENGKFCDFSETFVNKWSTNLIDTKINVVWSVEVRPSQNERERYYSVPFSYE